MSAEITHVSDTALMVAACRALETDSADGFIHDPFARRLAGDRGMALLQAQPQPEMMRFGMGVRTRFIDELLLETLASIPLATVLSVGCGLDTRPWRLNLPPNLHWIEVDFAPILDYKQTLLSAETPHCRIERLTADINDAAQRHTIYGAAGAEPALMITEGLLMYLPAATINALAVEAATQSSIAHWMADIMSTGFAKAINLNTASVRNVQAPDFLEGDAIVDTIRSRGWVTAAHRSYITDMAFAIDRAQRMMGGPAPEGPPPVPTNDPAGVHRFTVRP